QHHEYSVSQDAIGPVRSVFSLSAYFAVSRHHHRKSHCREHKSQDNIRYAPPFRESAGILGQSCDHGKRRRYAEYGRRRNSQRTAPTWHGPRPKNGGIGDSSLLSWSNRHRSKTFQEKYSEKYVANAEIL